jgi:hypothetical protein
MSTQLRELVGQFNIGDADGHRSDRKRAGNGSRPKSGVVREEFEEELTAR